MSRPARNPSAAARLDIRRLRTLLGILFLLITPWVAAQASSAPADLTIRQAALNERLQQLEARMLALTETLKVSEPDKAERVRAALDQAGKARLRERMDQVLRLMRSQSLGQAEQAQDELLRDLNGMLEALTGADDLLAKRHTERQRLEELKGRVRTLLDEQMQELYRTRQTAQRQEQPGADGAAPPDKEVRDMLKTLEELQRQTQQKTNQLKQEMQKNAGKNENQPGGRALEGALQEMQRAIERLQQQKAGDAAERQQKSGSQLQEALDQLDDALKQARKEEQEDTLAALDARLRSMLEAETAVRERITTALAGRDSAGALSEAQDRHKSAAEECDSALRIIVDEGTTVLLPELMRQVSQDMHAVTGMLERPAELPAAPLRLDAIITALQEMLAVVDERRAEQADEKNDGEGEQQAQSEQRPLVPNSAELKLLRSTQVRLNERSRAAGDSTGGAETLREVSTRQRSLAELAQRMSERR